MLYSFQLNLAAMSLIALFVGVFLIYNFSMFSVLSRRQDMSLLLTLGCNRGDFVLAFLIESLVLGAFGSLIGIIFGFSVAYYSIGKVSSTISQLYFQVNVLHVELTRRVVEGGLAVGFLATLVGGAIPALEVAITPPVLGLKRQSIEDKAKSLRGYLFILGALFLHFFSVVRLGFTALDLLGVRIRVWNDNSVCLVYSRASESVHILPWSGIQEIFQQNGGIFGRQKHWRFFEPY